MKYILLSFLILATLGCAAQKLPDMGLNQVRINEPERLVLAGINPVEKEIKMESSKTYYWYSANAVRHTQGGYHGRILDGPYTEFYLNHNLKEAGRFKKGLKEGTWQEWSPEGRLKSMYTWANGAQTGPFRSYDTTGRVRQEGRYRNGLLQGTLHNYPGKDSVETLNYNNGVLTPPKRRFYQRMNFLKKHPKGAADTTNKKP